MGLRITLIVILLSFPALALDVDITVSLLTANIDVFMLSGVTDVPIGTIFRGVWPFCIAVIVCVILLILFPQIALFIPSTM